MRRFIASLTMLTAGALVALATTSAIADTIEIDLTGLNLTFAGGKIYDSGSILGGGGIANATALGSIVFYKNSGYVNSLTSNVYADVLVNNVPALPDSSLQSTSGGSFFDLLTSSGTLLHLPVDSLYAQYTSGVVPLFEMAGAASSPITQSLPFGLSISAGDEVDIYVSRLLDSNTMSLDGNGSLVGFQSTTGTAQINGILVPEPSSLVAWLSLMVPCVVAFAWRRRRGYAR